MDGSLQVRTVRSLPEVIVMQRGRWISCLCLFLGIGASSFQPVCRGQNVVLPPDGSDKLDKAYTRDQRQSFRKMIQGEPVAGQEETIDNSAKWFAYRVTWNQHQIKPGDMSSLIKDFEKEVVAEAVKGRPGNQAFMAAFDKKFAERIKEVLQNERWIARTNAARMIARLAGVGYEDLIPSLLEILEDEKQGNETRLWAVKGLHDFFSLSQQTPPTLFKDQALQNRAIVDLIKFIQRKPTYVSANPSIEEVNGFRFVRRDAIRALALSRYPGVEVNGKLEGRTAQVLLGVMVNDNMNPPPALDEQVEAAIGVARLKAELTKSYQPDYTAYWLARFLADFSLRSQNRDRDTREGNSPWKVYGSRLGEALEGLRADTKESKSAAYVADLVAKSVPYLKQVELGTEGVRAPTDITNWGRDKPPASKSIYAGVADSVVNPGEAKEAEKPAKEADKPAKEADKGKAAEKKEADKGKAADKSAKEADKTKAAEKKKDR
jgi:hypothetical protein